MLMIAPRAIRTHSELIMSIVEYRPTPKVAAKNESALTKIDFDEVKSAIRTASYLLLPFSLRSRR